MNEIQKIDRIDMVKQRVLQVIIILFDLDKEAISCIDSNENLADQTGIDSLQAFEAIITLHELMEDEIPRDIDPGRISTLDGIAAYFDARYPGNRLSLLFDTDIPQFVAERRNIMETL